MIDYLGEAALTLSSADCNCLLERSQAPIVFENGCFLIRPKLPLGLSVTVVAVPAFHPEAILFHLPFDQIQGLGGAAARGVGLLWKQIRDWLLKQIDRLNLPSETVTVTMEDKVGCIQVDLARLNRWLGSQPLPREIRTNLRELGGTAQGLSARLAFYRTLPDP